MPHPVASGRRLNIYGKPIRAPATAPVVDPATTEFAFAYRRDTAAVQQNTACSGGDASGCIASFDDTSATATVSYEQAGAASSMLPYKRVRSPITDTSEMTTMVEARAVLDGSSSPAMVPATTVNTEDTTSVTTVTTEDTTLVTAVKTEEPTTLTARKDAEAAIVTASSE